MQNINKSLSALGDCVQSLVSKSKHVPFRNSKLTYLLQVREREREAEREAGRERQRARARVPFRNSKLMYLPQDSLGGESKALMLVCASPCATDAPETSCSLNFASRVRNVELVSSGVKLRMEK